MESIKIGLLGLGVVGSGVWKVIKENSIELTQCCGKKIRDIKNTGKRY